MKIIVNFQAITRLSGLFPAVPEFSGQRQNPDGSSEVPATPEPAQLGGLLPYTVVMTRKIGPVRCNLRHVVVTKHAIPQTVIAMRA